MKPPTALRAGQRPLYQEDDRGSLGQVKWMTRVPKTAGLVRDLFTEIPLEAFLPGGADLPGIRNRKICSTFGDVAQRWVLVFSQLARDREDKDTLPEKVVREGKMLASSVKTLFSYPEDVKKAWEEAFGKSHITAPPPTSSRKKRAVPTPDAPGRRRNRR